MSQEPSIVYAKRREIEAPRLSYFASGSGGNVRAFKRVVVALGCLTDFLDVEWSTARINSRTFTVYRRFGWTWWTTSYEEATRYAQMRTRHTDKDA